MRIIEKAIASLAILFIVAVFATQTFYSAGVLRPTLFQEESEAYQGSTLYRKTENIALKISDWPKASILINGEAATPKQAKDGYLEFEIYDRDVVEIDLRKTGSKEVTIFVARVTDGVKWPKAGTKIFESNGIRQLFKIEASVSVEP
jgi:hypothetical protein